MKRQMCALCVAVLVTCASWSVVAGDKEEAKQLFDAGLKLMRLDDFAGASANFERSVALYPTQNSLFNLANCYKAMQRYGDALAVVERLKRNFADKLKQRLAPPVANRAGVHRGPRGAQWSNDKPYVFPLDTARRVLVFVSGGRLAVQRVARRLLLRLHEQPPYQ